MLKATNRIFFKYYERLRSHKEISIITEAFTNKNCLEIGGPSRIFTRKGPLPLYTRVNTLTNVNFSYETIWENKIQEGNTFRYGSKTGIQYIFEASDLKSIESNSFEGVISSHCLEHTANPLKVLFEWRRVLKNGCYLLLILPDKKFTFDIKRPYTTFEHIVDDFINNIDEKDLTHKGEILELHDISKDPGMQLFSSTLEERCNTNFINRCMHHHVFNTELVQKMCAYTEMNLIQFLELRPYHMVYLIQKQ